MSLTTRGIEILTILLKAERALPARQIGELLGLTPRAVRYQFPKILGWLSSRESILHAQPGVGYRLEVVPGQKDRFRRELERISAGPLALAQRERFFRLLACLFASSRPVAVKQLQGQLGVSRGTVLKDMRGLEDWLANYQLKLRRRPNYGCWIDGSERRMREAWIDCCIQGVGLDHLLERLCIGEFPDRREYHGGIPGRLNATLRLNGLEIEPFGQLVLRNRDPWFRSLTDESQVTLVLGLAIQAKRLSKGRTLSLAAQQPALSPGNEHLSLAQDLTNALAQRSGIALPSIEILYLAEFLQRLELKRPLVERSNSDQVPDPGIQAGGGELETRVARSVFAFLTKVAGYLHPALAVDRELFAGLTDHLTRAASREPGVRLQPDILSKDLFDHIRPVYEAAQACSSILVTELGSTVSDEELEIITLYLAAALERLSIPLKKKKVIVICNAGRATALLLLSRIRAELPEVEVTGFMTYLEARTSSEPLSCDLVISTISIDLPGIDQVVVTPFLNPEELTILRRRLSLKRREDHIVQRSCLCRLLSPDVIQLNIQPDGWKGAVDLASAPLLQSGRIERRYVEAMKEVIDRFGPYMVLWPGVVLLHALPENGVKELCMSLATFRAPITFGHREHDPVRIALVLGAIDQRSHLPALLGLNRFLQNQEALSELRKTGSLLKTLKLISSHCNHMAGVEM